MIVKLTTISLAWYCPDKALIPRKSRSTLGPHSGSAQRRCFTRFAVGLALDCRWPRVPRRFVAEGHLCQGGCRGRGRPQVSVSDSHPVSLPGINARSGLYRSLAIVSRL